MTKTGKKNKKQNKFRDARISKQRIEIKLKNTRNKKKTQKRELQRKNEEKIKAKERMEQERNTKNRTKCRTKLKNCKPPLEQTIGNIAYKGSLI